MKAVVFRGIGDIRLEDVRKPRIEEPTDAVVRITTDLRHRSSFRPGHDERCAAGHRARP